MQLKFIPTDFFQSCGEEGAQVTEDDVTSGGNFKYMKEICKTY